MTPAPAALASTPITSISQIENFRRCKRRWGLKSVAYTETPQSDAGKLGDAVDAGQIQPYLSEGRPFDYSDETKRAGYIAASGLAFLPQPKAPGLELQRYLIMPSPRRSDGGGGKIAKFGYQGYLDLWLPFGGGMPDVPDDGTPCVGDFKTAKDLKWRKDEDALRVDPQAMLYATWAVLTTGKRVVDLVWIYFRTDPKKSYKAERTYVRVDATHVVGQFREIDETANELIDVRATANGATGDGALAWAAALPPNPEACDDYGGCPYRGQQCNLDPAEVADALAASASKRHLPVLTEGKGETAPMTMSTADNLARLRNLRAQALGQAPAPAAAPSPAPSALMGCSDKEVPAADPNTIPPAFLPPPAPQPLPINPPESALPPAPPIGTVAASPAPAPAPAPARRGRPPKSPPAAPPPAETPAPPPAPMLNTTPTAVTPAPKGKPIGTAYLDSYPVGGAYTPAEELYAEVNAAIQEKHGVIDYRLIDFKGAGVFASRLALLLDELGQVGDVVCDTRTPEGAIAKSVLASRAERVVQGCR